MERAAPFWNPYLAGIALGLVLGATLLLDRLVRQAIWSYYVCPRYILSRLFRSSPMSLWRVRAAVSTSASASPVTTLTFR